MSAPEAPNKSVPESGNGPDADENEPKPVSENLTAEEQLALFEKSLKEDDWGHQPC
jgi:hypothetical protein